MNFIKTQYLECFSFYHKHIKSYFLGALLSFFILGIGSCFIFVKSASLEGLVYQISQMLASKDISDAQGNFSALAIMYNNLKACLVTLALGCIPFFFLPAITLLSNAVILGILGAYYLSAGLSMGLFFSALLPHGFLEIPALAYAMGMGIYLSFSISRKVVSPLRSPKLSPIFLVILRSYLCIVLPLLVVSGALEAYVTPLVMKLFLP